MAKPIILALEPRKNTLRPFCRPLGRESIGLLIWHMRQEVFQAVEAAILREALIQLMKTSVKLSCIRRLFGILLLFAEPDAVLPLQVFDLIEPESREGAVDQQWMEVWMYPIWVFPLDSLFEQLLPSGPAVVGTECLMFELRTVVH